MLIQHAQAYLQASLMALPTSLLKFNISIIDYLKATIPTAFIYFKLIADDETYDGKCETGQAAQLNRLRCFVEPQNAPVTIC